MSGNSFDYYGYDKETYDDCISMIKDANRQQIIVINAWFTIMVLVYIFLSSMNLFGATQEKTLFYAVYFILALVFEVFMLVFKNVSKKYSIPLVYINIVFLLSYGILLSVGHPYIPAAIYLILIILISLLYMHTMIRISCAMILMSVIFIYCSYRYKTFSIAYNDTYNLVIVLTLGLGLHYMFQRSRLNQFVLYNKNLMIQQELEIKSSFDSLTGLLNRGCFFSIAEKSLKFSGDNYKSLCIIDLDGFKQINDTLGHQMGDKAIQITGDTILRELNLKAEDRPSISRWDFKLSQPVAGRLGGDEFIVLITSEKDRESVLKVLNKILIALNDVSVNGLNGIQASLGVTEFNNSEYDLDAAYKRADSALYLSKRAGKNQIHFYEDIKSEGDAV